MNNFIRHTSCISKFHDIWFLKNTKFQISTSIFYKCHFCLHFILHPYMQLVNYKVTRKLETAVRSSISLYNTYLSIGITRQCLVQSVKCAAICSFVTRARDTRFASMAKGLLSEKYHTIDRRQERTEWNVHVRNGRLCTFACRAKWWNTKIWHRNSPR